MKEKKNKLSSIQWEVWTASAEQQNAINVTYNTDVHRFHNINNQGVKCYWSSRVCVPICACVHTGWEKNVCLWPSVLLRECLVFHQHARAFLVVHATSGTHHVCGDKEDAGCQRITLPEYFICFIVSLNNVQHKGADGYSSLQET